MEVTPQNVQSLAEEKDEENLRFRSFLKASPLSVEQLDNLVFKTTDEVWAKVDCTTCGNCCKEVGPVLDQQDAERLAARLGLTVDQLIKTYLKPEEDPDEAGERWEMRVRPCPLLNKDNRCSVYEDRPAACRGYPYLHDPAFVFRTLGMLERASTCPIVFEVLERLKDLTDFHAADEDGLDSDEDYEMADDSQWPELLETGPTPWEAIRALARRLPQDHDLLESVLIRLRELVESGFLEHFNYVIVYLPAALALAAANLSQEQRRRTAYSLGASLKVAQDEGDELYVDVLSSALEAFGDTPPTPVEQWVESHRRLLKDWYDSEEHGLDNDPATERESILSGTLDPEFMDDASLPTEPTLPIVNDGPKIGRNDPCPCGSGKKYKKCCGK